MLLREMGCLGGQATPFPWPPPPPRSPPFFPPCPWLRPQSRRVGNRDPGLGRCCTTSPPQAANTGGRLSPPSPAPASPPGHCSWGSPEEHGEGLPLSKQMAPAPFLPSAALPFSGDTMAFCLPSHGLCGATSTAQHGGAQATAKMGCTGWREVRLRISPVGCSLQSPGLRCKGESHQETLPNCLQPCGAFVLERAECPESAGSWAASHCWVEGGHRSSPAPAHPR